MVCEFYPNKVVRRERKETSCEGMREGTYNLFCFFEGRCEDRGRGENK